jgi:hypothetical protein
MSELPASQGRSLFIADQQKTRVVKSFPFKTMSTQERPSQLLRQKLSRTSNESKSRRKIASSRRKLSLKKSDKHLQTVKSELGLRLKREKKNLVWRTEPSAKTTNSLIRVKLTSSRKTVLVLPLRLSKLSTSIWQMRKRGIASLYLSS